MTEAATQEQEKPDDDKNIFEQAVDVVDQVIPDTTNVINIPGKAGARSGVFDIDPVVGSTGTTGMIAGEKDTYGGALTPEGTLGPTMKASRESQGVDLNIDQFKTAIERGQIVSVGTMDENKLRNFVAAANDPEASEEDRAYFDNQLLDALDLYSYQEKMKPLEATVSYERDGKFVPTEEAYTSPNLMDAQQLKYLAEKEVRTAVTGKFTNVPLNQDLLPEDMQLLEQIVVDRVSTGSFFNVLEEKIYRNIVVDTPQFLGDAVFSWIPTAVATAMSYPIENLVINPGQFVLNTAFGTQFETRYVGLRERWQSLKPMRDAVERSWGEVLNDDFGLQTTQQTLQEILREELQFRLADDPERLERILNVTLQNQDGTSTSIPRPLINEEAAAQIVSASVNTLTQKERFGVNAIDTALILFGTGKARKAADKEYVDTLRQKIADYIAIGDDFGKQLSGMSFGEQLLALESANKIKKFNRGKVERTLAFEVAEDGAQRLTDDLVRLENELVQRQIMDGKTVASDRLGSYKKGQRYSLAGDTDLPRLRADIETIKRRKVVAKLRMHGSPVLKSTLVEGLPLAAAQYASGYFLSDVFGGDIFAAEGVGALAYIAVGRPTLKGLGYGAARLDAATGNMAGEVGLILEAGLNLASIPFTSLAKADIKDPFSGVITDKDLKTYRELIEETQGRKLTFAEQRALKYMRLVSNSLDPESRKMVQESLDTYRDLHFKIVSAFPAEQRSTVSKFFQESFADMSDLGWMRSASALAMGSVSALALTGKKGIEDASNLAVLQKRKLESANAAIVRLRQMIKENKGIDPEEGQVLEDYMKTLQATINKFSDDFDTQMEDMDRTVVNLLEVSLGDPSQDVKSSTIDALVQLGVDVKRVIDPELDVVVAQEALHGTARAALQERARVLEETRTMRLADVDARARDGERVLMSFVSEAKDNASAPLKALDAKAIKAGRFINVSGMITDLLKFTKDPVTGAPLDDVASFRTFFSKESQFFQGEMGQKVYKVFEEMASRSLRNAVSPATYEAFMNNEMIAMARKEGIDVQTGELPDYSHLDVALHLMENGDFRGFQAAPGEVMQVYAAFRDYAVASRDADLSRMYKSYASSVKSLVEREARDYYDEWQAGADHYKVQWFDRFQRMEGPASKTLKSQKFGQLGPAPRKDPDIGELDEGDQLIEAVTDVDEDQVFARLFQYGYATIDPGTMLTPLITSIQKAASGDAKDISKLNSMAIRLFGEFADKDAQGNLFFDFSNPKSVERYNLLQSTLNEYIYDGWARDVIGKLDTAAKRSRRTPGVAVDIRKRGGLNVNLPQLTNIDDVQDAFKIRIINGPNNPSGGLDGAVVYNMLDLEGMVAEQRTLQKLLDQDEDALRVAQQAANRIVDEVERQTKTLTGLADPKRKQVNQAIMEAAQVGRNSASFVERYIEKGTTEDLSRLAFEVRYRLTGGDPKITTVKIGERDVPIEQAINDGIATLLLDGLMQKGGVTQMGGDKNLRETFVNPEALFKIMSNDNSYSQIEQILGPEHASFMKDISQYFMMKSRAPMGEYDEKIKNLVTEFGVNKLISRAFNLRRGMVSPQYVAAELSVALATQAGIDVIKLAATDKNSALFMSQFLRYPENMTKAEIEMGSQLIVNFVITEFASLGLNVQDYLGQIDEELLAKATDEALEALKLKETSEEGES